MGNLLCTFGLTKTVFGIMFIHFLEGKQIQYMMYQGTFIYCPYVGAFRWALFTKLYHCLSCCHDTHTTKQIDVSRDVGILGFGIEAFQDCREAAFEHLMLFSLRSYEVPLSTDYWDLQHQLLSPSFGTSVPSKAASCPG